MRKAEEKNKWKQEVVTGSSGRGQHPEQAAVHELVGDLKGITRKNKNCSTSKVMKCLGAEKSKTT